MRLAVLCFCMLLLMASCKTSGPSLFGKRSPHQQYAEKLDNAGLKNTAMGNAWFSAADASLSNPVNISLPYKEVGYFSAELPSAVGLRFTAKRGERITVTVDKKSAATLIVYTELWKASTGSSQKLLNSLDTAQKSFSYDAEADEILILRAQPELLNSGEYTITIQNGPSLAFPVKTSKPAISSFWGDTRDGGARKHEGVDIFAARGTPLLAAANGTISRVETTNIGGKVVWLRTDDNNLNLYYAHLDEQLVTNGQKVKTGDVIGTVGNTGNAKTTGPHLHFGIYTLGGAIDPAVFIQPPKSSPADIAVNRSLVGDTVKIIAPAKLLNAPAANGVALADLTVNTPVKIVAATTAWCKVLIPSGVVGYVTAKQLAALSAISKMVIRENTAILDQPLANAARKTFLAKGETVEVLGRFQHYAYVRHQSMRGWLLYVL